MYEPTARVRVAYFVPPSTDFAGIERVVHEIAAGLMEAHGDTLDVHVIFASHYDEALLVNPPYTKHVLRVSRIRNLARSLRTVVRNEQFDVFVCAQVEPSVIAWIATRGMRLPVFIPHLHGNPRLEEHDGSMPTRVAFLLFRHVISRQIPAILVVSPSLVDYAQQHLTRGASVHFAKNPVRDLGRAIVRTHDGGHFRFLGVGRLSYQKGQDVLLRALALALPSLPPVRLTLVGAGVEEQRLRELSKKLGLDDVVVFAGYRSDPSEAFRETDCFVLASRWEGFGVVLIEALTFGLPLLASNCEFGPSDVITDSRVGRLVAVENLEAMAAGMIEAARSTPVPAEEEFRRQIAQGYTRGPATETHFVVLKQIAERARPRFPHLGVLAEA